MRLTAKREKTIEIPGDGDGAKVTIMALPPSKIRQINKRVNRMTVDPETGKTVVEVAYIDRARLIATACITDWAGMYDHNGIPMPCNQKNIARAADFVVKTEDGPVEFYDWVAQQHDSFADEVAAEEAEAEKN